MVLSCDVMAQSTVHTINAYQKSYCLDKIQSHHFYSTITLGLKGTFSLLDNSTLFRSVIWKGGSWQNQDIIQFHWRQEIAVTQQFLICLLNLILGVVGHQKPSILLEHSDQTLALHITAFLNKPPKKLSNTSLFLMTALKTQDTAELQQS